ncbi:PIN domain-containing protein [Megasphaera sp.]|uniref:PIN/TRAM domain-containing protein n=1 Tax=Megasphaera sp. TaxID=2023260 RepID=UPI001E059015|nr:PIN domain-containing protein [Megasphaera sp.]MBS6104122.1 PIN/TRAM domain-containing protein [Megasphaera sp.]
MEDKTGSGYKERKTKKFNARIVADNIMKGVIVLIMVVIFVMIADQLIGTPFISAEIEGEFFHGSIFGTTIMAVMTYIVGIILGALVGYGISPFALRLIWAAIHRIELGLNDFESQDIIVGTLGLLFGLIIANLIGLAFARLPIIGAYGPIVFNIVFGYAGMSIAVRKKSEIIALVGNLRLGRPNKEHSKRKELEFSGKLLDTSAIIDGRIAEICSTGFLEGPLLVPVFVLEELQLIADSSDLLKRNKGRRGLDILKQMQEDNYVEVRIINDDFDDVQGVDSKLVRLGRKINAKVVTNDYNLNKVAGLQGVAVLNINDLANALKPARVPGEQMNVLIVKAGKEENQGVAYLDDGTMIVVEDGQKYIGSTMPVTVTSVLQTSAGRMIFVKIANE